MSSRLPTPMMTSKNKTQLSRTKAGRLRTICLKQPKNTGYKMDFFYFPCSSVHHSSGGRNGEVGRRKRRTKFYHKFLFIESQG